MWNAKLFSFAVGIAAKSQYIDVETREVVKTRDEMYQFISEYVGTQYEKVISWARPHSAGPENDTVIKKMEDFFGIALTMDEQNIEPIQVNHSYSEFVKETIYDCYVDMQEFLEQLTEELSMDEEDYEDEEDDMDEEDDFMLGDEENDMDEEEEALLTMRHEIEMKKMALPSEVYDRIERFISNVFDPVIYDEDKVFEQAYAADIGTFTDDGTFTYTSAAAQLKSVERYYLVFFQLEEKLMKFGAEELNPYIVA